MERYRAVLRYPGAKWRMSDFILRYMPEHHSYLESYFGSGAVLFRKPPSPIETVNDINGDVVNLFRIVRDDAVALADYVASIPYARQEYEAAIAATQVRTPIERAARFLTRAWQSYGACADGMICGWKRDIAARESAYAVRNWAHLPEWIIAAQDRLKQVQIECRDAIELIKQYNSPRVLIYADPPYLHETRSCRRSYRHEMRKPDHVRLLDALNRHGGAAMISGYACELYDRELKGWIRHDVDAVTTSGSVKTECLWIKEAKC